MSPCDLVTMLTRLQTQPDSEVFSFTGPPCRTVFHLQYRLYMTIWLILMNMTTIHGNYFYIKTYNLDLSAA